MHRQKKKKFEKKLELNHQKINKTYTFYLFISPGNFLKLEKKEDNVFFENLTTTKKVKDKKKYIF